MRRLLMLLALVSACALVADAHQRIPGYRIVKPQPQGGGEATLIFSTTFPSTSTVETGVTRVCAEEQQENNPGSWDGDIICSPGDYIVEHGNAGGGYVTPGHANGDQITSDANFNGGGGGKGLRHWRADGQNVLGGGIKLEIASASGSTVNPIYVRFYMRYQSGFTFNPLQYTKDLYGLYTTAPTVNWTFGFTQGMHQSWIWRGGACGSGSTNSICTGTTNTGFQDVNGGTTGDGLFHCYQILHDSVTADNNRMKILVDGVTFLDQTGVAGGGGGGTDELIIGSNQDTVDNGGVDFYTDYDDIAISETSMPSCPWSAGT